jgi:hypothetical protein
MGVTINARALFVQGSPNMNSQLAIRVLLLLLVAHLLSACSKPNARLVDLVAEFGDPKSVNGEANYELKRRNDIIKREFELELENGKPGSVYEVTIDGVRIGEVKIDAAGEGKLGISDSGVEARFAEDFVEPKVGSVIKIGDIFEGPLQAKPPRAERK